MKRPNSTQDAPRARGRQCLPCTACCQGWLSADVLGHHMRAGHPCPHSKPEGCGIYSERPQVPCRTFICSWLVDDSPLPDWMRPDSCGAIVLLSMRWDDEYVISAVPVGPTIPDRTLTWLKDYARQHRRPLVFYERIRTDGRYTGLKRFGFGPPAFRDKVARHSADSGLDEMRLFSAGETPA
ncbi:hypothetical protein [Elongatibacter sediminis]|uniref:C2H2-type domain-containing protein n=1 Tax=Elongatibacter sediminis TaxID=3119006 RepID=A0AAW9RIQ0_9GAMM